MLGGISSRGRVLTALLVFATTLLAPAAAMDAPAAARPSCDDIPTCNALNLHILQTEHGLLNELAAKALPKIHALLTHARDGNYVSAMGVFRELTGWGVPAATVWAFRPFKPVDGAGVDSRESLSLQTCNWDDGVFRWESSRERGSRTSCHELRALATTMIADEARLAAAAAWVDAPAEAMADEDESDEEGPEPALAPSPEQALLASALDAMVLAEGDAVVEADEFVAADLAEQAALEVVADMEVVEAEQAEPEFLEEVWAEDRKNQLPDASQLETLADGRVVLRKPVWVWLDKPQPTQGQPTAAAFEADPTNWAQHAGQCPGGTGMTRHSPPPRKTLRMYAPPVQDALESQYQTNLRAGGAAADTLLHTFPAGPSTQQVFQATGGDASVPGSRSAWLNLPKKAAMEAQAKAPATAALMFGDLLARRKIFKG